MLLSVIVPVYNVEKYLERCIDSILDQGDFTDYEIILVDDGSTDSSGLICDNYKSCNSNIIVIHKENGGLSSARNAGLMVANGKYIQFVDSDDYIKSNSLKAIIETAETNQTDILAFNYAYVFENGKVEINDIIPKCEKVMSGEEYLLNAFKTNTMQMCVWKNIYLKSMLDDNEIAFREGFVHEDEEWTPRAFIKAKAVLNVGNCIYAYCIRNNSISQSNQKKAALDLVSNCEALKKYSSSISEPELKKYFENNIVTLALSAFYKGKLFDEKERIEVLISTLEALSKTAVKKRLFCKSCRAYFCINSITKNFKKLSSSLGRIKKLIIKTNDYLSQKVHKTARGFLYNPKQIQRLNNHSFSIISSTCNGGVITSELGEQFRTPTINIWMDAVDYLKMISNLEHYFSLDVKEVKNSFYSYPVGKIDDITIYFMHYHSFEEARNKWNERKQRVNYDDLYFMMAERNGCTSEMVKEFDSLPFKNKVIFTYNGYPEYKSAICVKDCCDEPQAAIMTDFVGLYGRKYDKYLDCVSWLNGELNDK